MVHEVSFSFSLVSYPLLLQPTILYLVLMFSSPPPLRSLSTVC